MKHKKIAAVIIAMLLAAALCACSGGGSASGEVSFTDMAGKEISLDKPAEKIVALTAADCEILYAIGAQDTLVGRGEYCDYPAEVTDVAAVQSGSETNIEQIVSLAPDVVIMSKMDQTEEQIASLEDAGIKVVVSDAQNIEGVYTAIGMIGTLTGKNDEAAGVVDEMKTKFEAIAAKASEKASGKSVYFEVSPLEYGLWTTGSGTFMDEIAQILGAVNAFADVEGWAEISEEQVIERNPDYIVTVTMFYGEGETPEAEIAGRNGWENVTAIKDGKVYRADSDCLTRPGPRLADGAEELYSFLYE